MKKIMGKWEGKKGIIWLLLDMHYEIVYWNFKFLKA